MKIKVQEGQTLVDIAIQYLGSESATAGLAALNGLDLTADILAGDELELPAVSDKRVVRFFLEGGYNPASVILGGLEGIDYWAIERDFIVQ